MVLCIMYQAVGSLLILLCWHLLLSCRRPMRLGGGLGGDSRVPKEPRKKLLADAVAKGLAPPPDESRPPIRYSGMGFRGWGVSGKQLGEQSQLQLAWAVVLGADYGCCRIRVRMLACALGEQPGRRVTALVGWGWGRKHSSCMCLKYSCMTARNYQLLWSAAATAVT